MTIDELIERLNELKSIAKRAGDTQVAVDFNRELGELEWCVAELQTCGQIDAGVWKIKDDENNTEVVRIY